MVAANRLVRLSTPWCKICLHNGFQISGNSGLQLLRLFLIRISFMKKRGLLFLDLIRLFLYALQFLLFFFIFDLFCLLLFHLSYFFFSSHSLSPLLLCFHRFHKFMIIFSTAVIDYDYFHCCTRSYSN